MRTMRSRTWAAVAFALLLASLFYRDFIAFAAVESSPPASNSPPVSADQRKFFEAKIRPVLQKSCFGCHSAQAKEIEGGLLLDSRVGLRRGGENGPVIVPGNVGASKLIEALRYTNKDLQMPPDDNGGKLPDSIIHDFESWVRMGAPDPRDDAAGAMAKAYDTTEAKK